MSLQVQIPDIDRELTHGDLPEPCGWQVLLLIPKVEEKTEGGVYIDDDLRKREEAATVLAYVMKLGPKAYDDKAKFGNPWCEEGNWVIINSYAGIKFSAFIEGEKYEFRIVNDENIRAVVPQPKIIRRV